jgi:hypothetical protein
MAEDDHTADGWAILHDRTGLPPLPDTASLYLLGPLPSKELADLITAQLECPCLKTVVPIFFPAGIRMMLAVPLPDTSMLTDDDEPIH